MSESIRIELGDECQTQIAEMTPDELMITEMFVCKIMGEGRREYGPLVMDADPRSVDELLKEASDEGLDLMFYILAAMRKIANVCDMTKVAVLRIEADTLRSNYAALEDAAMSVATRRESEHKAAIAELQAKLDKQMKQNHHVELLEAKRTIQSLRKSLLEGSKKVNRIGELCRG